MNLPVGKGSVTWSGDGFTSIEYGSGTVGEYARLYALTLDAWGCVSEDGLRSDPKRPFLECTKGGDAFRLSVSEITPDRIEVYIGQTNR